MRKTVWHVAQGARLHWSEWDGEFVLFHENSANTHQLNLFAATAVKLLCDEPAGSESLTQKTAAKLGVDVDAELQDDVDLLLSQLKTLGILEAQS